MNFSYVHSTNDDNWSALQHELRALKTPHSPKISLHWPEILFHFIAMPEIPPIRNSFISPSCKMCWSDQPYWMPLHNLNLGPMVGPNKEKLRGFRLPEKASSVSSCSSAVGLATPMTDKRSLMTKFSPSEQL